MFVAFAAAIGAFVASTLLSAVPLQGVLRRSADIYANATPRVLELAALRQEVHLLDDQLSLAVDARDWRAPVLAVTVERLKAQAALVPAGAPPEIAGAGWAAASSAIAATLAGTAHVRDLLQSADTAGARRVLDEEVRPAAERADAALWHLVEAEASAGVRAAQTITSMGAKVTEFSVGLDAACVVLTAFLAMGAIRAVRRHTALIEARSRELEQFAARVAHDFRGPLTPVLLAVHTLGKGTAPGDPMHTTVARAKRSLGRMTSLVDDLLAFARAGGAADPNAAADVRSVVDAVVDEATPDAHASNLTLQRESGDDVQAACSAGVLGSLLSNLVRNAIKYMGQAVVRRVVVRWQVHRDTVRVEVSDTGPGLPADAETSVFDPYVRFDRTGQSGIGLGLATVKRLAEGHGGAVGVRSTARGCTFWSFSRFVRRRWPRAVRRRSTRSLETRTTRRASGGSGYPARPCRRAVASDGKTRNPR